MAIHRPLWPASLLGLRDVFVVVTQAVVRVTMSDHLVLVGTFVGLQLTELSKTFVAYFTAIRLFSRVKADMLVQLTRLSERLPALVTLVRFFT